jgi:hypothetical protein
VISDVAIKVGAATALAGLLVLAGWHARGVVANNDMLEYQAQQAKAQELQRAQTAAVEVVDTRNTTDSTARLDVVEQARAPEVVYVTQEVIKYRDRPDAGRCVLPVDWVRLYNTSGAAAGRVPETGATRPKVVGVTSRVH